MVGIFRSAKVKLPVPSHKLLGELYKSLTWDLGPGFRDVEP
jgi:hypothetical protein